MGEKRESKLHHIIRMSWESEQMPGWEDSLSMIVEATKKEFQIKSKDAAKDDMKSTPLSQEEFEFGEDFSV